MKYLHREVSCIAEAMPAQRRYVITPGAHSWEMAELGFLDPVPCYGHLLLL